MGSDRIRHRALPFRATLVGMAASEQAAEEPQGSLEIPEDVEEWVRALCLGLPEVTVRIDESRVKVRSTAYAFYIRRRPFCLLVAVADPSGRPAPLLVLRADPDEREALLSIGHPFFAPRGGPDRIGVWLSEDTDWEEIRELVTESYRDLAPKKLIAGIE
jgi:YjbR